MIWIFCGIETAVRDRYRIAVLKRLRPLSDPVLTSEGWWFFTVGPMTPDGFRGSSVEGWEWLQKEKVLANAVDTATLTVTNVRCLPSGS